MEGKKSIKELVAENLASANDERKSRVVELLAEQTKDKQVQMIVKGIEAKEQADKELANIRPSRTFNSDGTMASEFFTQEGLGQRKKAQEKCAQLTQALDKAIDEGNFEQLGKLVKGGGGQEASA